VTTSRETRLIHPIRGLDATTMGVEPAVVHQEDLG